MLLLVYLKLHCCAGCVPSFCLWVNWNKCWHSHIFWMETRLNLNFVHVFPRHIFKSVTCRTFSEIKFSWVVSLSMYIIFWFCCKPRITCYYVTPSFFQSLPISYHPMRIRQDSNLCQGYMLYAGTANCTYYF